MPHRDQATGPSGTDTDTPDTPATPATSATPAPPSRRPGPGRSRLFVAVGDRPARWYRSPGEAADDARELVPSTSPGDTVARAWDDEATAGPPSWELRRNAKRGLSWERPGGDPC